MTATSPDCYLSFQMTYKPEVLTTSSLDSINLLKWFKEVRGTFCFLDYHFIIKGYDLGIARWKRYIGQGMWKRVRSFHALSEYATLSPFHGFIYREALSTLSWVFIEASLHRHNWLNHWPLTSDSTYSPFSSQEDWGIRAITESFNPLITWLVPLATSLHP